MVDVEDQAGQFKRGLVWNFKHVATCESACQKSLIPKGLKFFLKKCIIPPSFVILERNTNI